MDGHPSGYVEAWSRGGFRAVVQDWRRGGRQLAARTFPVRRGSDEAARTQAYEDAGAWMRAESRLRGLTRNVCVADSERDTVRMELEMPRRASDRGGAPRHYHTTIDRASLPLVARYIWHAELRRNRLEGSHAAKVLYAVTEPPDTHFTRSREPIFMHDLIAPGLTLARHANGDTLDNRRANIEDAHQRRGRTWARPRPVRARSALERVVIPMSGGVRKRSRR